MKAHYFTAKQKEAIKKCAEAGAQAQIMQACARTDAMWALSMYNIGLSVKTINRTIKEKQKTFNETVEYRKDGVLDFGLQYHLDELGINLKLGFDEI